MNLNNDIVLRPRFSIMLNQDAKIVLEHFKSNTKKNSSVCVSVIEPHIFLKITKEKQHFWSPQLHLEVLEEGTSSTIKGLFGPNPVVWTMFMFLHFIVAGVFIGCGVWAYVNPVANTTNDCNGNNLDFILFWWSSWKRKRKRTNEYFVSIYARSNF